MNYCTQKDWEDEGYAGSFAGFVRSLAGLDAEAERERFGQYFTGNVFNSDQQEFIKLVVNYIKENGEITGDIVVNQYPFKQLKPVSVFGDKMPILVQLIKDFESLLPAA